MITSSDRTRATRDLKYFLVTALTLNCLVSICLVVMFSKYHSSTNRLNSVDISAVENTLRNQPSEEGRQNAITLLLKADKSLRSTTDAVREGFYFFESLLLGNIIIGIICVRRLSGAWEDKDRLEKGSAGFHDPRRQI